MKKHLSVFLYYLRILYCARVWSDAPASTVLDYVQRFIFNGKKKPFQHLSSSITIMHEGAKSINKQNEVRFSGRMIRGLED